MTASITTKIITILRMVRKKKVNSKVMIARTIAIMTIGTHTKSPLDLSRASKKFGSSPVSSAKTLVSWLR